MKTIKEVLDFCNEFTICDLYIIARVIEMNHVGECVFIVLSKCDFISEDNFLSFGCDR